MSIEITPLHPTPMQLIQKAMDSGLKMDELGKLFDLQERW